MRKIVGLIGKLGSGKDTVASFLVEFGWQRIAFSDALYEEVSNAFNVSIAFLQNRATKETPLSELALVNFDDPEFLYASLPALREEDHAAGLVNDLDARLAAPRSPRRILQIWGTEYRRQLYTDDYWRSKVAQVILNNPETSFVITDVRFPNEALMLQELGAELARVVRTGQEAQPNPDARVQHVSETSLDGYPVERVLVNEEGPQGLVKLGASVIKGFVVRH